MEWMYSISKYNILSIILSRATLPGLTFCCDRWLAHMQHPYSLQSIKVWFESNTNMFPFPDCCGISKVLSEGLSQQWKISETIWLVGDKTFLMGNTNLNISMISMTIIVIWIPNSSLNMPFLQIDYLDIKLCYSIHMCHDGLNSFGDNLRINTEL